MWPYITFRVLFYLLLVNTGNGLSSSILPFTNYQYSIELESNVADLWWTVDDAEREIIFELHVKTTGWIALGISPAGGMRGADIGIGWVDQTGNVHFQDRYSFDFVKPLIDNTTTDWFALQGREQNGWTAIQFKRLLDTCDSMDYPIKSGTNVVIFAYGLIDPDLSGSHDDISYHENHRGTKMIPLRFYGQPPQDEKFAGLDYFDFHPNNYLLPSTDTTYHCKVYKLPSNYTTKRHVIAHKTLIDPGNEDLIHHLLLHECDQSATFNNDSNLPDGPCNEITDHISACITKIAIGWTIGGDRIIEFSEEIGYPIGGDSSVKYYMIQMHYDNPKQSSNRRDSSGLRFYLSNELRQHDVGYLVLGTDVSFLSLAIPPRVDRFIVDSYCPSTATRNFPETGITIFSALPHTHLQGHSMWTKLIRNNTAVQYLFNAEAYDFNYQFANRFPKGIQLYPGDEFATRCVYNTMNKGEITLGGERTKEEMCFHTFAYYPRMDDLSACFTVNTAESFENMMHSLSSKFDFEHAREWLLDIQWTPELATRWQEYYNNAPRLSVFVREGHFTSEPLGLLPKYRDLEPAVCKSKPTGNETVDPIGNGAATGLQKNFVLLSLLLIIKETMFIQ